jgi:hypothetical protein
MKVLIHRQKPIIAKFKQALSICTMTMELSKMRSSQGEEEQRRRYRQRIEKQEEKEVLLPIKLM